MTNGNPTSRRILARTCADALTTHHQELDDALHWFDQQELSVSSIEKFCRRVRDVSEALRDEAAALERRAHLRDADTVPQPPLLGYALETAAGVELHPFSLNDAITSISCATGPAASALGSESGGARKDTF